MSVRIVDLQNHVCRHGHKGMYHRLGNNGKAACRGCERPRYIRKMRRYWAGRTSEEQKEIYRKKWESYSRSNPEKVKARRAYKYAVLKGKLVRPSACGSCGSTGRIEGHHPDYSKPLEVIWLCRSCHLELHNQLRHGLLSPTAEGGGK